MGNDQLVAELLSIIKNQEKYNKNVVNKYIEVLQECNDLRIAFSKAADARNKLDFENKILKLKIKKLGNNGIEYENIER